MRRYRALAAVSTAHLAAALAAQAVAVRRRRAFDTVVLSGDPAHVGRDSWWFGTAFSPPAYMLAVQAWAIARLLRGEPEPARVLLRVLGSVMVPGYLVERLGRERLTPTGFDPVETPVVVAGVGSSVAMAVLGRRQLGTWP
jgi:hypothetical protein